MSKHTPAPWTIREGATSITVVGANGEALYHDDKRLPGAIEDARLIAAAPELLEACEIALESDDRAVKKVLRAAIAKARGENNE